MKQILQSLRNGNIVVDDIPIPKVKDGYILIKTSKTLISSGTERNLIKFGKSNYIQKALSQPAKVREAIYKIKNDGILETYKAISNKLDTPTSLGYCNVGTVILLRQFVCLTYFAIVFLLHHKAEAGFYTYFV